jgi:hypothetical protein
MVQWRALRNRILQRAHEASAGLGASGPNPDQSKCAGLLVTPRVATSSGGDDSYGCTLAVPRRRSDGI